MNIIFKKTKMKKLICIDSGKDIIGGTDPMIEEGNPYTVKATETLFGFVEAYQLLEVPDEMKDGELFQHWYDANLFIPVSEIDEMKFERKKIKTT